MLKSFFNDSETILWARLQTFVGAVGMIVTYVEPEVLKPVIPAAYFPWLLVANGVLSEYLRRRRATDL
jgi:hypothetical protein